MIVFDGNQMGIVDWLEILLLNWFPLTYLHSIEISLTVDFSKIICWLSSLIHVVPTLLTESFVIRVLPPAVATEIIKLICSHGFK